MGLVFVFFHAWKDKEKTCQGAGPLPSWLLRCFHQLLSSTLSECPAYLNKCILMDTICIQYILIEYSYGTIQSYVDRSHANAWLLPSGLGAGSASLRLAADETNCFNVFQWDKLFPTVPKLRFIYLNLYTYFKLDLQYIWYRFRYNIYIYAYIVCIISYTYMYLHSLLVEAEIVVLCPPRCLLHPLGAFCLLGRFWPGPEGRQHSTTRHEGQVKLMAFFVHANCIW